MKIFLWIWTLSFTGIVSFAIWQSHNAIAQNHRLVVQVRSAIQQNHRLAVQGAQAHRVLCKYKGSLQEQVAASTQFLNQHPHGIDGITGGVIRNGIARQQATLTAIAELNCK